MTSPENHPAPQGSTFHLVAKDVWEQSRSSPLYRPEAFETDGFVHCTDGLDNLLVPANAYYRNDPRAYLALEIDLGSVSAPTRYDDEACLYPHIYGPVDTLAVVDVLQAERTDDGTFTGFLPIRM